MLVKSKTKTSTCRAQLLKILHKLPEQFEKKLLWKSLRWMYKFWQQITSIRLPTEVPLEVIEMQDTKYVILVHEWW